MSAAVPVLQPPTPHQSALPLTHQRLLQQPAEQSHPAAGDELRAPGHIHTGMPWGLTQTVHTVIHSSVDMDTLI